MKTKKKEAPIGRAFVLGWVKKKNIDLEGKKKEQETIASLTEEPPHRLGNENWRKMCDLEKREVENQQPSLFENKSFPSSYIC